MNSNKTQLHTEAQKTVLSASEKSAMHAKLLSYMNQHPLPAHGPVPTYGFFQSLSFFSGHQVRVYASAAFAFIFVLTGVSYAAESAVPGDLLYAMKVEVNEEVQNSLAFSPEAKAEWATERAKRRIVEVKQLATEGELDSEREIEASEYLKEHVAEIARNINEVQEADPGEAFALASQAEATLSAQAETLALVDAPQESVSMQAAELFTVADEASVPEMNIQLAIAEAIAEIHPERFAIAGDESASIAVLASVESQANDELHQARTLFQSNRNSFSAELQQDIDRRFEDIDRSREEEQAAANAPQNDTAEMSSFSTMTMSLKQAVDVQPLQRTRERLHRSALLKTIIEDILNLGINVKIDDILPKDLTAEESASLASSIRQEAVAQRDILAGVKGKDATQALSDVDMLIREGDAAVTRGEFEVAIGYFRSAFEVGASVDAQGNAVERTLQQAF